MRRVLVIMIAVLQFLFSRDAMTQTGQVFIHTDKVIAYPGDTVWFRGYILTDSGYVSGTNFLVELYDDTAGLITRKTFPITIGASFGQVELPQKPGLYWLRAYTFNCSQEAIRSLTVRDMGLRVITRTLLSSKEEGLYSKSPMELLRDTSGYSIHFKEGTLGNYSLAVSTVNEPGNGTLSFFRAAKHAELSDTTYIAFTAEVKGAPKESGKQGVVIMFQQDTIVSPPQLLPVDSSGHVSLSGLYFFDTAYIHYKFNDKKGNMRLLLHAKPYPDFVPPPVTAYRLDTLDLSVPVTDSFLSKPKYLKTVVVKGQWKDRHRALNRRYVLSPEFAAMEQFTYDLRDSSLLRRFATVLDFVYGEIPPGWAQNSLLWSQCRDGVQYYIDEKLVWGEAVQGAPLGNFAYCKLFTDLHPPCPCICLYTRKGRDLQFHPLGMNMIGIKGYDRPLQWNTPDKITLLWNPWIAVNIYRFSVPAENFQIRVAGVMASGEIFSCEKTVVNGIIQ